MVSKKLVLIRLDILRRTEFQGRDEAPVEGVAYRHTQNKADDPGHQQADQAAYYLP